MFMMTNIYKQTVVNRILFQLLYFLRINTTAFYNAIFQKKEYVSITIIFYKQDSNLLFSVRQTGKEAKHGGARRKVVSPEFVETL